MAQTNKKTNAKLSSARTIILISSTISVLVMVAATVYTGDMLYLVAAVLFAISGVASVVVIKNLSEKMGPR